MKASQKYKVGLEMLRQIDGEAGEKVIASLQDIFPDLGRYIIELVFGDIYTRPELDLKKKEIAVVAALTALGTTLPQLKIHIHGALNTGCSINEVKEVILQMSVYAGFPACLNAMNVLRDILAERQKKGVNDEVGEAPATTAYDERLKTGEALLAQLDSLQLDRLKNAYNDFFPDIINYTLTFAYGDIYSRDNLDKQYRQVATIAALTAMGNAHAQLKFHMKAGLNIGLTLSEIKEILLLMAIYAGFPAALNGVNILKEVVHEPA